MNIVSINSGLDQALRDQGHRVLSLCINEAGLQALQPLLEERLRAPEWASFTPDALVQQEWLGKPVLFSDLPSFSGLKFFWSIDSHLNLYWHRHYARLFDAVFTPHFNWWKTMPGHWRLPHVHRLATPGCERPWRAHAERARAVGFVGRLQGTRNLRVKLTELLKSRYQAEILDNLSHAGMLDFYGDTRLIPNESIAFEVNFRLLEGASCGCCVLSPNIGEDQDALFEPGAEILVYQDALELEDLIDFCLRKPRLSERVGLAGRTRVLSGHLPEHRARDMSRVMAEAPRSALSGAAAAEQFWLAVSQLRRNGVVSMRPADLEEKFVRRCPDTPAILAARVYLAAESQDDAGLQLLFRDCLERPLPEAAVQTDETARQTWGDVLTACGSAAIQAGDVEMALRFWDRYAQLLGETKPRPDTLAELCATWATSLGGRGLQCQPGLIFNPTRHCQTALDMALLSSHLDPLNTAWAGALAGLESVRRHLPELFLGAQARLSLHSGGWRPGLDYARACLRCFRIQEGLEEMRRVLSVATEAGEKENCLEVLRNDGNSHILTRLAAASDLHRD